MSIIGMKHLLDTPVLSEFLKKQPDERVTSWVEAQVEESLFLSVITMGEIEKGIWLLPASKRRSKLETWLEETIYRFEERTLGLEVKALRRWGRLTAELEGRGRVLPLMDSLIAATALTHNLTIITRNEADFADTGCQVFNPWLV